MASVWNTSRARIKGFISWTAASTVREKWPRVPSPIPSRPSSVSSRGNSQFFQRLPTRYVLTSLIFISSDDCDFHDSQRRDEPYTLFQLPESSRIGMQNWDAEYIPPFAPISNFWYPTKAGAHNRRWRHPQATRDS